MFRLQALKLSRQYRCTVHKVSTVDIISPYNNTIIANFATARSRKANSNRNSYGSVHSSSVEADIPQFAGLLRQFYRQSHPDLLRASHNQQAEVNDQSWQTLNGILSTIKEVNSYPPRMSKNIPFYIRSSEKDAEGMIVLKHVELRIRTAGGECKKQLTVTLQDFFVTSGISSDGKFSWGKEYFPLSIADSNGAVKIEDTEL